MDKEKKDKIYRNDIQTLNMCRNASMTYGHLFWREKYTLRHQENISPHQRQRTIQRTCDVVIVLVKEILGHFQAERPVCVLFLAVTVKIRHLGKSYYCPLLMQRTLWPYANTSHESPKFKSFSLFAETQKTWKSFLHTVVNVYEFCCHLKISQELKHCC